LQSWFRSKPLPLPKLIASPPAGATDGESGVIVLPEGEAALLLEDEQGQALRISWERVEDQRPNKDRRRALPAGQYKILGLRQVDRSREGELWHTSTTGRQLGFLDVEEGEQQTLELDRKIVFSRALRKTQVAMGITHPSGAGLSIYKDGRRIPITYELHAADGRIVRHGAMNYG
jgi:hypothetical protein